MGNALQVYESSAAISLWREPEEVLAEAKKAATALMSVMGQKQHKVVFNNEQYLEREDWGTVAKFYGCTAKVVTTQYVEFGNVRGFEATAVCITHDMREIGRAESLCLDDEENWGEVPKYEWQDVLDEGGKKIWDASLRNGKGGYKAKKVQAGTVKKPLFQLKSMAQTRAEAKVLKSVFGWVVVLAGFRPTPAEEMTGNEQFEDQQNGGGKKPVTQPKRESDKKKEAAKDDGTERISGKIEELKAGKEGAVWIVVEKKLIVVEGKFVNDDLKVGETITVNTQKRKSNKVGDFYAVVGILENPPEAAKGEVLDPEPVQNSDPGENQFPEGTAALDGLFEGGEVQKASEAGPPKTIGPKRAQRLYAIMNQNKKDTGLDEAKLKAVLGKMKRPLEHLSDLEIGLYEMFEKLVAGEISVADVEQVVK